jgi:Co/Zn/Cd efflux system component
MNAFALLAAYIPYEQGERYAHGEHIEVPAWAAVGAVLGLVMMVWHIWKVRSERRSQLAQKKK